MLKVICFRPASTFKLKFVMAFAFSLCLLSSSGCGLFSSDEPSAQSNGNVQVNPAVTPADVKKIEDRIAQLKTEKATLEVERSNNEKEFEDFKKKCEANKNKSYRKGIGCAETEKREDALAATQQKLTAISNEITTAEQRLEQARINANSKANANVSTNTNANANVAQSPSSSGGDLSDAIQKLFFGLVILAGIALLMAIYALLRKEIAESNRMMGLALSRLDKQIVLSGEALKQIDMLKDSISSLQTDVRNINKKASGPSLRNNVPPAPVNTQTTSDDSIPAYIKPLSMFPNTVENLLEELGANGRPVEFDYASAGFVEDENGHFLLGRELTSPYGYFILPRFKRFQTRNDYFTHYAKYYECQNPGGGEVVIIKPAMVTANDGGWRLEVKGELEVS